MDKQRIFLIIAPNECSVELTKRDKILQTTLKLLVKQGLQETAMSQISRESGVATGTIYHYFKGKNDIINNLYLEIKRDFGQVLLKGTDSSGNYQQRFSKVWRNLFNYYLKNELQFRFAQHIGHLPIINEETRQAGQRYYQPVIDFLREGINNGELKNIDLQLLTETLHGNIVALVQIALNNKKIFKEELIEQAIRISWDGIKQ